MKIGIGQFAPNLGDIGSNLKKISRIAKSAPADLWVFPEMSLTGYMFRNRKELIGLIKIIDYPDLLDMLKKISQSSGSELIVGLPEIIEEKIFNTVWVVNSDGLVAKNQKTHLFLKEKFLFSPGQTGPTLFSFGDTEIGLGICYDYMFPEYWRNLALRGAQIFINPANFVFNFGFQLMRTRAIENGVFSVCVNRVGKERGQEFLGGSEAVDNRGKVLFVGSRTEYCRVLYLDEKLANDKKWNRYNDLLCDRRIDMY